MTIIADLVMGFEESADLTTIDQGLRKLSSDASVLKGSGHSIVSAPDAGSALRCPSGAGFLVKTITSDSTVPYICFAAIKRSSGTRRIFVANYVGLGLGVRIDWKSDGKFEVFDRTGTSKGTTVNAYASLDTRYFIQVSWSTTNNSQSLNFYVNGTLDKTFTASDWRGGGTNSAGLTEFDFCYDGTSATTGADIDFDDMYLLHETGGFTSLNFGNLKVETIYPTSDDATSQELTVTSGSGPHYAAVDEIPPDSSDSLKSHPLTGSSTRTDLFGFPQPLTDDPSTKKVYAFCSFLYAQGSNASNDRLSTRVNLTGNASETQTISNVNGNGSLPLTPTLLYRNPFAMPINVLASGGGGVSISSFHNYTFGPRVVRGATVIASSFIYTFALSVAKSYFVPAAGWTMGYLGFA
jgi:hypothetical protein